MPVAIRYGDDSCGIAGLQSTGGLSRYPRNRPVSLSVHALDNDRLAIPCESCSHKGAEQNDLLHRL